MIKQFLAGAIAVSLLAGASLLTATAMAAEEAAKPASAANDLEKRFPVREIPNIAPAGEAYYSPDNIHIITGTKDPDAIKNKNGTLEMEEVPEGPIKQRYTQIDRDKDNHITRIEYDGMRRIFNDAQNVVIAIKPGGEGDILTPDALESRGLPQRDRGVVEGGRRGEGGIDVAVLPQPVA